MEFETAKEKVASLSPQEELRAIRRVPREEQKRKMAELKSELMKRKEMLSSLQLEIYELLQKTPEIERDELQRAADEFVDRSGVSLPTMWRNELTRILDDVFSRRRIISEFKNHYPEDDDLFEAIYGKRPLGKVEIIEGPVTFYFKCWNFDDYLLIFAKGDQSRMEKLRHFSRNSYGIMSSSCPIPELNGIITAENSTPLSSVLENYSLVIQKHEERHAIHRIMHGSPNFHIDIDYKEILFSKTDQIASILKRIKAQTEEKTKGEILASLKEKNFSTKKIYDKITTESGPYDYLWNFKKFIKEQGILNKTVRIFIANYKKTIKKALQAHALLVEEMKYSPEKAIAFLQVEELVNWPKAVRRLSEFKTLKAYREWKELFEEEGDRLEELAGAKD